MTMAGGASAVTRVAVDDILDQAEVLNMARDCDGSFVIESVLFLCRL